jgi:ATP-dependent Lon protease
MENEYSNLNQLPMLPLRGIFVFPHTITHLDVGREKSIRAIEDAALHEQTVFLATQKDATIEDPTPEDLYAYGTIAVIKQMIKLPGGVVRVLIEGQGRGKIENLIVKNGYYLVVLSELPAEDEASIELEAQRRFLLDLFEQYVKLGKKIPPETYNNVSSIEQPGRLADVITSHMTLKIEEKQRILAAFEVASRLDLLIGIIKNELEILELEKKISSRVRRQMEKTQREYYLREQLKAIQKELGDKDERSAEADDYRQKVAEAELPESVAEKAEKEIARLEKMPPLAAEAVVVRNYLDWLIVLPWSAMTKERIDLKHALGILDQDHYGLDKVKERIIEFLAVRRLTKTMRGPILCLVGPPGVGKTSLARSIARSIGRNFTRISLGGVRDEAEIRGHRRTYVGALPGRIIQGIKQAGSSNPVFLMDEIDKMSMDFRGDPSSALLEVLDPEQNFSFSDHYLEIPYDLSSVMFITTANAQHNIPRPLLDRMELIYLSGYSEVEKIEIAKRHILPRLLKDHGLVKTDFSLPDATIGKIINEYTREAGVRDLERQLAAICRKLAKEKVISKKIQVNVNSKTVGRYLGLPRKRSVVVGKDADVGVVTGLAWTETGGEILIIEVSVVKGKGTLQLTGQIGEVMQESARAGLSFLRSFDLRNYIADDFYEKSDIHIHVPEGAIPKDGPSAGISMAAAMLSAITVQPIKPGLAMTGEVTLRGKVLPVGGIREKVLAAARHGLSVVVLPEENMVDVSELPTSVKRKIKFVPVNTMADVIKEVFVTPDEIL